MAAFPYFFSPELTNAIGWTIVHSLWQGIVVAGITLFLLQFLQKKSAQTRYVLNTTALFSLVSWIGYTFYDLYQSNLQASVVYNWKTLDENVLKAWSTVVESTSFEQITASSTSWSDLLTAFTIYINQYHLEYLVNVWLLGICLFALKFIGSFWYTQRIKHYGTQQPPDRWQEKFLVLQRKMKLTKPVQLVTSTLVQVPMVIGHIKPVILLPIATITGLSAHQIEAIIAHELAHIKRHDYLINILQGIIEVILFYHPLIWWLSHKIRTEREHCCDDMAIQISQDKLAYAKALTSLTAIQINHPTLAMAFSGNNNELTTRIKRLFMQPKRKNLAVEGVTVGLLALGIFLFLSWNAQADAKAVDDTTTTQSDPDEDNCQDDGNKKKQTVKTLKIQPKNKKATSPSPIKIILDTTKRNYLIKDTLVQDMFTPPIPANFGRGFQPSPPQMERPTQKQLPTVSQPTSYKKSVTIPAISIQTPRWNFELPAATYQYYGKQAPDTTKKSSSKTIRIDSLIESYSKDLTNDLKPLLETIQKQAQEAQDEAVKLGKEWNEKYIKDLTKELEDFVEDLKEEADDFRNEYQENREEYNDERREFEREKAARKREIEEARREREQEIRALEREMKREHEQEMREYEQEMREHEQEMREHEQEMREHEREMREHARELAEEERERKAEQEEAENTINNYLIEDGLWDGEGRLHVKYNKNRMIVNGKRVPARIFKKYQEILGNSQFELSSN